jgi:nitroreductase
VTSDIKLDNAGDLPTSPLIEDLARRVSVRDFSDRPVDDALIDTVLKAAFRAPTSSNIQAYSVVVVRNQETKDRLSVATGNQRHVKETPVFLAFCADLTRIEGALQRHGHSIAGNNLEVGLVSSIDASLVGMSAYLCARSLGLAGVMIGGVRNDATKTAEILELPHRAYCVFGMCLGWPGHVTPQKPRMAFDAVVHRERYGSKTNAVDAEAALDDYDRALAAHYERIGKVTTIDSWTHDMDRKFHPALRNDLRQQLKQLGFDFL